VPEIQIPSELMPADGRFGCGPSRMREAQLAAFTRSGWQLMGTSHRQAPIKNMVGDIQRGLLDLFQAPQGYEVILGNGGSTAFWDAAAYSLVTDKAQALVHGEFGAKFAQALAAPWLSEPEVIRGEPGSRSALTLSEGVDAYAYPHNETSTGVVTEVRRVASTQALMLTDATSAAGGIKFDAAETDAYYFAPQKNFGSDGGLWLALVSPAAIERIESVAGTRYIPEFLSLKTALDNSRLNQTLNTPAIATLFLLREQISWMLQSGGIDWADARTRENSSLLYDWAEKTAYTTPFVANPEHRSPVVVTIDFAEGVDAGEVAKTLRANGIVDVEPYRKLGRNQLRVATFVATERSEISSLITCIEYVVERM
jgi:phosphoserine aminotransferase